MNKLFDVLSKNEENYIFPFLWLKGETKEIIQEEIQKIYEANIKAFCVESRPHPHFLEDAWWDDMDFILAEAKRRNMKVWLLDDAHFPTGYANGIIEKKYPERKKTYINYNTADVWNIDGKVAININEMTKPQSTWMDLNKPLDLERKNNKVLAVIACRLIEEEKISDEDVLDLTPKVNGEWLNVELPEGFWRIFTIYKTKTDGGNDAYINMLDETSIDSLVEAVYNPHYERYGDYFGDTFMGFFSDEPGFGNTLGFAMDDRIGHKDMPLPWSKELETMLMEKLGQNWLEKLPLLWVKSQNESVSSLIRYTYMELVTDLYAKNFSKKLGKWCSQRSVEYIGHVIEDNGQHARLGCGAGHYFKAMSGQHMSGIDTIGQQIIPGGQDFQRVGISKFSGSFFHHTLGKLGASSGHLDPNKNGRTMCELFGAYGWKLGVRDMKWIVDHLLARGINQFVPHAFSMAEYPDLDCPPHFYARGNNPQYRHFKSLMKYINRMGHLLNNGRHLGNIGILYHAESEWMGEYMDMSEPARHLMEEQIDFNFIYSEMLVNKEAWNAYDRHEQYVINDIAIDALVIPYSRFIEKDVFEFICKHPNYPVIFLEKYPEAVISDTVERFETTKGCVCIPLEELSGILKEKGFNKIQLDQPSKDIVLFHYFNEKEIIVLNNESIDSSYEGNLKIKGHWQVTAYDAMLNMIKAIEVHYEHNHTIIPCKINIYESLFLILTKGISQENSMNKRNESRKTIDLSAQWKVASTRSKDYPKFSKDQVFERLESFAEIEPGFSGIIKYSKEFEVPDEVLINEAKLVIDQVYECMTVWIDGEYVGERLCPPYIVELQTQSIDLLTPGKHEIVIEVATTLHREQIKLCKAPFQYVYEPYEPTGILGRVKLLYN